MKNGNWWVIYNWDHEQQNSLECGPQYIMDDGCRIRYYLNIDLMTQTIAQKLFKQMKMIKTFYNLFIWNKTFEPKKEKLGQGNRSQRNKQTQNSILMLCRYSRQHAVRRLAMLSAQEYDSCSGCWEISWRLWSLQRWSLHGDHYSRFHMLNKRNCRKNRDSNWNDACV